MQGIRDLYRYGQQNIEVLDKIKSALDEIRDLGKNSCRIYWLFEGVSNARHSWYSCIKITRDLSFLSCMDFQRKITYSKKKGSGFLSCYYCYVSQKICVDGYKTKGESCTGWKHIILSVAKAILTDNRLIDRIYERVAKRQFKDEDDYINWLGQKQRLLIGGHEMSNVMAVFKEVLLWREEEII
jgi:hypothetical protein